MNKYSRKQRPSSERIPSSANVLNAFTPMRNAAQLLNTMKGMTSYGVMEEKDINHYNLKR